jgi:hypothetical protein
MKLAVKFYEEGNEKGVPTTWPKEVKELGDLDPIPSGYTEMTVEQYNQYRSDHRSEYDSWRSSYNESFVNPTKYKDQREEEYKKYDGDLHDSLAKMASVLNSNGIDIGQEMIDMLTTRQVIKDTYPKPS